MQLVVFDFHVQPILFVQKLYLEWLVEELKCVICESSWFAYSWEVQSAILVWVLEADSCAVWDGGEAIEWFQSLQRGEAVEYLEIQVQYPHIPVRHQQIHSFINLFTELNIPNIDSYIHHLLV